MLNKLAMPLALALFLTGCQAPVAPHQHAVTPTTPVAVCHSGDMMMQTTLWFGLSKPDGGTVSAQAWQQFIDNDVTPRFKDGLSVYDAKGQWLGENGRLARENSKALMLIHRPDSATSASIDALREIYKKRFNQESVMRVDALVCVAF
ncbi:DUF3574 domain-containing protein [Pantoea eucrina]|uniref:DUF3574 domain-containing protein n=1 Tax=Pantoea eucrina TaxID=472693 RepID=A0ABU5LA57_9GAMM|nr:DUF3574 domain-containing protein [Pantoea eucrina]MDZ7276828.1 DUF3574 domain-containing protein [Pantoea eucrina]